MNSPINDSLRIRLGAAVLALATLAAIVFGIINFQQRAIFSTPDDGVSWLDTSSGVIAWHIAPNSPAANAGIRTDDKVLAINDFPIHNSIEVTKRLWHIGLWSQAHYRIERGGKQFEALLVTQPAERPASIENYLRVVGLLLSLHWPFYFRAPLERDSCRAFLHFLPSFLRPVFLPIYGQAEHL